MKPDLVQKDVAELSVILEAHGISATRQRREIAQLLLGRACHFTADQLMDDLASRAHGISKATVYNTLKLFVERGLLREIHADGNRAIYDTTTTPHHHYLNVDTGELHDIPIDAVCIAAVPEAPEGTVTDGVDVIIRVHNA